MKPIRNPAVRTKVLPDGHVVLMSDESEWAHTITPVGGIAWEFCDGNNTFDEIINMVRAELPPDYAIDFRDELRSLLTQFVDAGLLLSASDK